VGRTEMPDQGLTSLVMQLLEGWSLDPDRGIVCLGGEVARAFNQDAKYDLAHAG
jgi:hypothetical protein